MENAVATLQTLRRPTLLVRAARHALREYERDICLKRLLPGYAALSPRDAIALLLEREAALDHARREGTMGYSAARHIEVIMALIGEARLAESEACKAA